MEIITYLEATSYFGNTVWQYTQALGAFVISLLLLKAFQLIVIARVKRLAKKTKTELDDIFISIFTSIKPPFYLVVSLFIALQFIALNGVGAKVAKLFFILVIVYEVIRGFQLLVDYALRIYAKKNSAVGTEVSQSLLNAARMMTSIALWSVGGLVILSNLGVNVTSLAASLGIGGIAIALAIQNILSDIFSSFSIYVDKPFEVGDFIQIGEDSGTVEKIGLKTTRLKTLRGEELVVANKELTTTRIQNFKKLNRRREVFKIGVAYETPREKLNAIPGYIELVIGNVDAAEFSRCHLDELGDSSVVFETVYHVDTADYNAFMDAKQTILLGLIEKLGGEGIEFAYPTQEVILRK